MRTDFGRESRVYVAGHGGLVGSAVIRRLQAGGFRNLIVRSHAELDLCNQAAVAKFFGEARPEFVVLAAAKVGGILANETRPVEFVRENLLIQANVIHESHRAGVERLVFLGSSCIYPRDCPQPIREDYLLTGPLEPTNQPYAIAKIAGIEMCAAYNREFGTKYVCAMPTNLFGIGDNFDLQTSHVLPALIRKAHEARASGAANMDVWGSGNPRREFLLSDDLAAAIELLLASQWERVAAGFPSPRLPLLNVGAGRDLTIRELAELVCDVVGFKGALRWDSTKPDGTPRKLLDTSRMQSMGWKPVTALRDGIRIAYQAFLDRPAAAR